jgi:hypothetical protein
MIRSWTSATTKQGEIPSKPEVEREGVPSIGRYGGAVDRKEIVAGTLLGPGDELPGKHAQVRAGVDQEPEVADPVGDE